MNLNCKKIEEKNSLMRPDRIYNAKIFSVIPTAYNLSDDPPVPKLLKSMELQYPLLYIEIEAWIETTNAVVATFRVRYVDIPVDCWNYGSKYWPVDHSSLGVVDFQHWRHSLSVGLSASASLPGWPSPVNTDDPGQQHWSTTSSSIMDNKRKEECYIKNHLGRHWDGEQQLRHG